MQFAQENEIIDITLIQQEYEKMKRQQILDGQKIWLASDGRWKTYVDIAGQRKLIAKSNRAALENAIFEMLKDPKVKFKDCFDAWVKEKLDFGEIQRQTYDRYTADYKRYIHGTDLERKEVKTIDELYLENFIKNRIADGKLTAKNWGNMRILINGAMIYARKHGYTDIRISLFMQELQLSSKIFKRVPVVDEEQIFNEKEETEIKQYVFNHSDMLGLGVVLGFVTGMRIGEVSALRWSDWNDDILTVQRTEIKYKDLNGEWVEEVREWTKGKDGIRQVVLTDEAKDVLRQLYEFTGSEDGYIFLRDNKRIKAAWLSNKIESICRCLQIRHRSFHKIRKTYATNLLDAGVDEKIVTKQMGHTEILTTKRFYYYNKKEIGDIKSQLEKCNQM